MDKQEKQLEQRVEDLELGADMLGMQVEKLDRLVYKLFKRLPSTRPPRRVEAPRESK